MKNPARIALILVALMASTVLIAQDSGTVKITVEKNINGTVTVEEHEFEIEEGQDINELIQEQGIDIDVEEIEGVQRTEIVINGAAEDGDRTYSMQFPSWNGCNGLAGMEPKPFLGITKNMTYEGEGVMIDEVIAGSSAEKMGLESGDIITQMNGQKVTDFDELVDVIGAAEIGDKIDVRYERDGKKEKATEVLGERKHEMKMFHFDHDDEGENFFFGQEFDHEEFEHRIEEMAKSLEHRMSDLDFEESFNTEEIEKMMKSLKQNLESMDFDFDGDGADVFDFSNGKRVIIIVEDIDISPEELDEINTKADPKVSVNNDLSLNDLRFFPNPNDGRFELSFSTADRGDLSVVIYDALGEKVYYEMLGDFSGDYANAIDISNRPAGSYFLQFIQNGKTYSKKLVKE